MPDIITTDNKMGLIIRGTAIGFFGGGILEETGWTGFAKPKLREKYGILNTGVIIGVSWGLWHFLPVFWGCGDVVGQLDWALFLPGFFFYILGAPAYRVLMVWVHEHTKSLFMIALMHASLSASLFFIFSFPQKGLLALLYYFALSVEIWIVVLVVMKIENRRVASNNNST